MRMRRWKLRFFLAFLLSSPAHGMHPMCHFMSDLKTAEDDCTGRLKEQPYLYSKGCRGTWDNISCWDHAEVGEMVSNPCPAVLRNLFGRNGMISKNCTANGWSDVFPSINSACGSEADTDKATKHSFFFDNYLYFYVSIEILSSTATSDHQGVRQERFGGYLDNMICWRTCHKCACSDSECPGQLVFYMVVKTLYTLGHSLSLIALITGSTILCLFRKLHCTRNYIHLNLFLSFILRAVAILVKDAVIFSHDTDCTEQPPLIGCKACLVIFNYFVMANFFWLLVEGLYLHTLLMVIFSKNRHFLIYLLIGWGIPTVFLIAWVITRIYLEDTGCWERNDNSIPYRVINGPIVFSIIVNFVLFINIIRILVQKLRCADVGGNDQSQYRRLAKSTLLLIPLFGVNYVIFVYLNEKEAMENYKIFFELAIGSFQGLVVAILYCFLNSEVQSELKRMWRSVCLTYLSREYRLHSSSLSQNGSEAMSQFHRKSRAQSFLQTETTVL